MEVFVPFLIAAAFFAYSVYSNFVKEQEKARKRNPAETKPRQEKRNIIRTESPEPVLPQSPPPPQLQTTRRPKTLEVIDLDEEKLPEEPEFEFDLRSAVIQDAILRRPSY